MGWPTLPCAGPSRGRWTCSLILAPAPVGMRTCASRSSSADLPLIRNVMHLSAEGLADLARRVRSSAFETPLRPVAAIALMFAGRRPSALSCSRLECTSLSEKHRARSRRSTDCRRGGVGLRGAERRTVGALHASSRSRMLPTSASLRLPRAMLPATVVAISHRHPPLHCAACLGCNRYMHLRLPKLRIHRSAAE